MTLNTFRSNLNQPTLNSLILEHKIEKYSINQRRYLGNKYKVLNLIDKVIKEKVSQFETFCDIFAGTGVVGHFYSKENKKIISNDLLYSNYISIYSFLGVQNINKDKIEELLKEFNKLDIKEDNYVSYHFGDRFFSHKIAKKIGYIREKIDNLFLSKYINFDEKTILLSSLLYAMDRVANTVGHYDAYIKKEIKDREFILKFPFFQKSNKNNQIYNEDANELIKKIKCDVLYIDPPYNSRQYCDAYHLLENIIKWEKPEVFGVAKKFDRAKLKSKYSLQSATETFSELIKNANCKYILFSYNNMQEKGNIRSNAKISDEDIFKILGKKGEVEVFEQEYKEFNTGKKNRGDNKERVFFVEINR